MTQAPNTEDKSEIPSPNPLVSTVEMTSQKTKQEGHCITYIHKQNDVVFSRQQRIILQFFTFRVKVIKKIISWAHC